MREMLTRSLGRLLWGLIEGSSVVVFELEGGRVSKMQQPRTFIRLLNLLAFQEWTARYEKRVGLQIARYRREIAKYVLQCGGVRCKVAPCLGIEAQDGRLALVTRWIKGRQPDREEVIPVSRKVVPLFLRAGLSTWPVCTLHPRFHTNFILDADGMPWIIDLESHVLAIFVPLEELWDNLLVGNFPPLDDIHFPKLWRFYRGESDDLPAADRERFRSCIEECEKLVRDQKGEETRVWSRILDVLLCVFRLGERWDR